MRKLAAAVAVLGGLWMGVHFAGDEEPVATASAAAGFAPVIARAAAEPATNGAAARGTAPAAADPRPYELDDLAQLSRLDAGWLAAHGFTSAESWRRLHALLDARTELQGAPREHLAIRPSGAQGDGAMALTRLAAEERYVLADLPAQLAAGEDTVLVRWRRLSDGTVMDLGAQSWRAASAGSPQVWMHTPQDWDPGSYRLEIISANPALQPLAAADFEIVARGEAVSAFSYPLGPASTN